MTCPTRRGGAGRGGRGGGGGGGGAARGLTPGLWRSAEVCRGRAGDVAPRSGPAHAGSAGGRAGPPRGAVDGVARGRGGDGDRERTAAPGPDPVVQPDHVPAGGGVRRGRRAVGRAGQRWFP